MVQNVVINMQNKNARKGSASFIHLSHLSQIHRKTLEIDPHLWFKDTLKQFSNIIKEIDSLIEVDRTKTNQSWMSSQYETSVSKSKPKTGSQFTWDQDAVRKSYLKIDEVN